MPLYRPVFLVSAALLFTVSLAADDVQSLSDVVSTQDAARLRKLFTSAEPYSDLTTPLYLVRGLKALGPTEKDKVRLENACDYALSHLDTKNLNSVYLVSSIAKVVGPKCVDRVLKESSSIQTLISGQSLDEGATIIDLHQTVTSAANLGLKFDSERVLSLLTTVLENEESIFQTGMVFLTAAQLPVSVDLSSIFEQIEDVIAQADETPTALFYDSLETTSTVVTGIFAMATRMGEAPAITPEQATKFGNYLISNKYTANLTTASQVLSAASALDRNEYVVPSTVLLVSPRYVTRDHPNVKVRLSTILGSPVTAGFLVQLKTVEDVQGKEIKKSKPVKMEDGGIFSYNLFEDVTNPGVYTLTFSSQSSSPSPISALTNIQLQVTLSYTVTVGSAKFSLVDREQGSTTKSVSLEYPNSSKSILDADQHSKVVLTFNLLNKATKKSVIVHQAFVRLSLPSREIFFVATPDKTSREYTFELDMTSSASDFGSLSGSYAVSLIVGDFSLENPFSWDIGTINLVFSGTSAPPTGVEDLTYKAKPVIEHMFRVDEKLPPKAISTTFTVLALSPLAVLLTMWLVLGANISGIGTGGLWTVIFHIGLGSILFLYYIFWIKLNMFDTFKLLALLSVPTFVAGNRMLRKIAKSNKHSA